MSTNDAFTASILALCEEARKATEHLPKPIASVSHSKDGQALEIMLDSSANYYSEWIKGEGGDIALYRDQETSRLVGAHFPCYAKTLVVSGEFGTIRIDLATGKVEVEAAEQPAHTTPAPGLV